VARATRKTGAEVSGLGGALFEESAYAGFYFYAAPDPDHLAAGSARRSLGARGSRKYGLSIEGLGALAWDWAKGILILIVIGSVLTWILYAVIRKNRRLWWFYFWLISITDHRLFIVP